MPHLDERAQVFAAAMFCLMRGKTLLMPDRLICKPDRNRLAARFEYYQAAN